MQQLESFKWVLGRIYYFRLIYEIGLMSYGRALMIGGTMRSLMIASMTAAALLVSGCGGTSIVTRSSAKPPDQIRSATFSSQSGNSSEVTGYISEALASQGVATRSVTSTQGFKSNDVDAIISYVDVWRWDISTYLKSIAISLYNAKTGELLVTGRWSDSLFHTYFRGDYVSKDLIKQMFEKLELKQGDFTGIAALPTASEAKPKIPSSTSESLASSSKSNATQVSKNEYTAREQARAIQCTPQGILGIESIGSPREEITFDCGGGRKVTIVCRTGLGCS